MKLTKQTINRSVRTFFQSAIAYISVNLMLVNFADKSDALKNALVGLLISAISAGISAVMNLEREDNQNDNGQLG